MALKLSQCNGNSETRKATDGSAGIRTHREEKKWTTENIILRRVAWHKYKEEIYILIENTLNLRSLKVLLRNWQNLLEGFNFNNPK